jgi:hypothetical protein
VFSTSLGSPVVQRRTSGLKVSAIPFDCFTQAARYIFLLKKRKYLTYNILLKTPTTQTNKRSKPTQTQTMPSKTTKAKKTSKHTPTPSDTSTCSTNTLRGEASKFVPGTVTRKQQRSSLKGDAMSFVPGSEEGHYMKKKGEWENDDF